MTQEVKKGRGRPKGPESIVETPVMEQPKKKKRTIKRKEKLSHTVEYEIIKGGGIVFMLPQKGVTIYDKEDDTVREIRYCPNEPSIFVDEQSENAVKESVIFNRGRLFVPREKPNLKQFLDLHPANKENGGTTFRLVDKKKDAISSRYHDIIATKGDCSASCCSNKSTTTKVENSNNQKSKKKFGWFFRSK